MAVLTIGLVAVGDPSRTRTVWAAVLALVALGLLLAVGAAWVVRSTRRDPEVLGPLEVLGDRSFRRGDPVWQRRRLDEARPSGAVPLAQMAPPPNADAAFDGGPVADGFEDLVDDEAAARAVELAALAAAETAAESDGDDEPRDVTPSEPMPALLDDLDPA
jgi:hypothetical protein